MTRHGERGFTLVELLVTIAIIGIVAAVAMPQLLRARSSGNEASAIASMRAIHSGEAVYASSCARGGYAQSLNDLALPPAGSQSGFVSPDIAANGVSKSGYVLNVGAGAVSNVVTVKALVCNSPADDAISSYFAEGHPVKLGTTGFRSFGLDFHGTIYQEPSGVTLTNVFPSTATPVQ